MRIILWALLGLAHLLAAQPEHFHPPFVAYDAQGQLVRNSGRPVSSAKSCVACHDTEYIRQHDLHARLKVSVDCLACHTPHQSLPTQRSAFDARGTLSSDRIDLQAPADEQCLTCHGAGAGYHGLTLPQSYLDPSPARGRHALHLSRDQGSVYSAEARRDSRLNLAGKDALAQPWDLHAARLVSCVDCHYSPNKPGRRSAPRRAPGHLRRDPRQLSSASFLKRPDHDLASANCLHCHDPLATHAFLPYAQRHFERLDCRSCHVPAVYAPVLMQEDRAALDEAGRPRQVWRNLSGNDQDPLNARLIQPFYPYLLNLARADGSAQVRPVNLITERAWQDGEGRELDFALVRRAGLARPKASPHDNTAAGLEALREQLLALGVKDPRLHASTRVVPLAHGVQEGPSVLRRCLDCHAPGSRMDQALVLGNLADPKDPSLPKPTDTAKLYLPGLGHQTWSTRLGFAFFLITLLGVSGHALGRWLTRQRRRAQAPRLSEKVYLYGTYERFWHWTMAASTLGLVLTGLEVHFNAGINVLGFALAVKLHNALAVLLMANAALSLFYHLSTARIGQFLPQDKDLRGALRVQILYYMKGIFEGTAHPIPKTIGRKMNALQQLTYLALLNVLLPFQVLSGILIWGAGRWPAFSTAIGGLSVVTPLHNLGSWLFLSFTLGHVYLTTTGHSLTSNLHAMVDGWDEIDAGAKPEEEDYRGAD